jgi:hypothetical protein
MAAVAELDRGSGGSDGRHGFALGLVDSLSLQPQPPNCEPAASQFRSVLLIGRIGRLVSADTVGWPDPS